MSDVHPITLLSDEAFGWYVSGLVDGEACFDLRLQQIRSCTGKLCPVWYARFAIEMRADETPGLQAIARRMGCGHVRMRNRHPTPTNGYVNPQVGWKVDVVPDLAGIIVPHFERFPLQMKKANDFAIWKLAVRRLAGIRRKGDRRATPEDRAYIAALREQLSAGKRYNHGIMQSAALPPDPQKYMPLFDT